MTTQDCPTSPITRPLQIIWTPADAAAAAVDANGLGVPVFDPAALVPNEFDRVKAIVDAHTSGRGHRYRGRHRANKFSHRVEDIEGGDS